MTLNVIALCVLSYLFGSIPFGLIFGKWKGVDLRKEGSGNIGAANAVRNLGPILGVLVLIADILKSIVPLEIARLVLGETARPFHFVIVGICAILGHNYSCFLRFRGGKGVASTVGVFLFLSWKATITAFSFWLIVVSISRFAALGSLTASLLLPFFINIFKEPHVYFLFSWASAAMIVYKHRNNVKRLVQGKEHKLTFKKEQR